MYNNRKELLALISTISNIEDLELNVVKKVIEEALATGVRKDFSKEASFLVEIDEKGNYKIFRKWLVVDDNELKFSNDFHVYEDIAKENFDESLVIGDEYKEEIENFEFKRGNATVVKQVLKSKVREAKSLKEKEYLKSKNGELLLVEIKKYDKSGYVVEYNNQITGFIPYSNLFTRSEKLKIGNTYSVVLDEEKEEVIKGFSVIFTRNSKDFILKTFEREVPEIEEELIEIKNIIRFGKKIIVTLHTSDKNVDPIGTCVGYKGVRIQSISKNFNGDRIQLVKWQPNTIHLIQENFDVDISKVVFEDEHVNVILTDENYATFNIIDLQNVFSDLMEKDVFIFSDSENNEKSSIENKIHINYLMDAINLDEDSAEFLVDLGIYNLEDITESSIEELIEKGLEKTDAIAIKNVALESEKELNETISASKTNLKDMSLLNNYMIDILIKNDIKNKNDLAELSILDLLDIVPLDQEYAGEVILEARKDWIL